MSSGGGPDPAIVKQRVFEVIARHPKVQKASVAPTTSWSQMGLDSLDSVELIMAMEEEFIVELPDQAVRYYKSLKGNSVVWVFFQCPFTMFFIPNLILSIFRAVFSISLPRSLYRIFRPNHSEIHSP